MNDRALIKIMLFMTYDLICFLPLSGKNDNIVFFCKIKRIFYRFAPIYNKSIFSVSFLYALLYLSYYRLRILCSWIIRCKDALTVSYTHLDVYKRQAFYYIHYFTHAIPP